SGSGQWAGAECEWPVGQSREQVTSGLEQSGSDQWAGAEREWPVGWSRAGTVASGLEHVGVASGLEQSRSDQWAGEEQG
ncbi:hypothetical protein chiPu_0032208, partial [Chiloscyllium punctatum]|nr:hypothetical protein [Chiloscyllium punctatum]